MKPINRAWKLQNEMAEEGNNTVWDFVFRMESAIKEAVESEREACAMIADFHGAPGQPYPRVSNLIAEQIRARSQEVK